MKLDKNKKGPYPLPSRVKIIGKTWTIREDPSLYKSDSDYGKCCNAELVIILDKDQHIQNKRDTLLHEILHAVEYEGNIDLKEKNVRTLATLLLAVLRENPEVFSYLVDK